MKEKYRMEVILLEDVKSLGKKGQIVKINDGYARNFVLPKKLGLEANAKNLNDLKLQKARDEKHAAEELQAAKEFAAKIEQASVKLSIKTGEGGRTFGAVSTKEIQAAAKAQLGFDIDKKKMKLDEAIKTPGTHIIAVKLHRDVTAKLKVVVEESK
jgi:large subunit ribosomal protein L9